MVDRRGVLAGGVAASVAAWAPRALAQGAPAMLPVELSAGGAPRAFKMHPRIAIGSYPIRFIMAAEANAGGRVGIFLTMVGPTEADLRALAEEAHGDLATRIAATTGKQVISPQQLAAEPAMQAFRTVPGNARWDQGALDPMGKRFWYLVSTPRAPLLDGWGTISGSHELSMINRMTVPSRALDAVVLIPSMTLEFSTLTGSVKSGSAGSTAWAGGEIRFGFKPQSHTLFMAGGKRSIEMVGGSFYPKGRILISPTPISGEIVNNARDLPADMAARLGNGRHDVLRVNVPAWRELVRSAYRGYNEALVRNIAKAIG